MSDYKIEKDIPLIPKSKWTRLFDKMEIGDSIFFIELGKAKNFANSISRSRGKKYTKIRADDNGYRVWRLK